MSETIIRRMSEVELQEVQWLWKPYIPFGKLVIIQGDPGDGKTTFALRLAAACSSGVALPGMESTEPFNVIYQTAEDGLGDTIKPRLIEAGADENMVLNIIEDTDPLSLSDERIEKAITETGARLMILDPIQGYIGEDVDINRANEIRTVLKKVATVADRTGCAIVMVGHLNKAKGQAHSTAVLVRLIFVQQLAVCCLSVGFAKNLTCVLSFTINLRWHLRESRWHSISETI